MPCGHLDPQGELVLRALPGESRATVGSSPPQVAEARYGLWLRIKP